MNTNTNVTHVTYWYHIVWGAYLKVNKKRRFTKCLLFKRISSRFFLNNSDLNSKCRSSELQVSCKSITAYQEFRYYVFVADYKWNVVWKTKVGHAIWSYEFSWMSILWSFLLRFIFQFSGGPLIGERGICPLGTLQTRAWVYTHRDTLRDFFEWLTLYKRMNFLV